METCKPLVRSSLSFLGRFTLIALIFFLGWKYAEGFYTATLVPVANWIFAHQNLPLAFKQQQHDLLLIVSLEPAVGMFRLYFTGHELIYMNSLAAAALLVTLPGWQSGQRGLWAVAILLLLWVMHAFSLCAGGYSAVQKYLSDLPPEKQRELLAEGLGGFSATRAAFFGRLVGSWSAWGAPVLILLPWVLSAWRYLGLERGGGLPSTER